MRRKQINAFDLRLPCSQLFISWCRIDLTCNGGIFLWNLWLNNIGLWYSFLGANEWQIEARKILQSGFVSWAPALFLPIILRKQPRWGIFLPSSFDPSLVPLSSSLPSGRQPASCCPSCGEKKKRKTWNAGFFLILDRGCWIKWGPTVDDLFFPLFAFRLTK